MHARIAWRLESGGRYRATLEGAGGHALLCLDPCVWIDPRAHAVGPLELDPPREVVAPWLAAPAVSVEELNVFPERLAELGVDGGAARLPASLPVRQGPPSLPRPVLQLLTTTLPGGVLEHGRVSFEYGEARIASDDARDALVVHRPPARLPARSRRRGGVLPGARGDLLLAAAPAAAFEPDPFDEDLLSGLAGDQEWLAFVLDGVPKLIEQGWRVEMDPLFRFRVLRARRTFATLARSGEGWLDVALGVEVDGETIDLLPVLAGLVEGGLLAELLATGQPEVLERPAHSQRRRANSPWPGRPPPSVVARRRLHCPPSARGHRARQPRTHPC